MPQQVATGRDRNVHRNDGPAFKYCSGSQAVILYLTWRFCHYHLVQYCRQFGECHLAGVHETHITIDMTTQVRSNYAANQSMRMFGGNDGGGQGGRLMAERCDYVRPYMSKAMALVVGMALKMRLGRTWYCFED